MNSDKPDFKGFKEELERIGAKIITDKQTEGVVVVALEDPRQTELILSHEGNETKRPKFGYVLSELTHNTMIFVPISS